ncbi:hypothetical protein GCM10009555_017410 [Acrocarpospora macrocephala]|uniref:Uncharacterized protein n=1 Tax=Acrocarpospora macrocephala TaxID=150177 RepID=A0A5M3WJN4_9ACTN|nr:hypothetical protein Amac_009960 [Acrocarpospora macrocephala]
MRSTAARRRAICPARMRRSRNVSDLAILTLHWMEKHPERYADLHPDVRPYLVDAGLLAA